MHLSWKLTLIEASLCSQPFFPFFFTAFHKELVEGKGLYSQFWHSLLVQVKNRSLFTSWGSCYKIWDTATTPGNRNWAKCWPSGNPRLPSKTFLKYQNYINNEQQILTLLQHATHGIRTQNLFPLRKFYLLLYSGHSLIYHCEECFEWSLKYFNKILI